MKNKKIDEDVVNYRLEKINKIKKKPVRKGFFRLFEEKNDININSSNVADGSLSQKIFNKSGNKKNVTLRMLDFEQDNTSGLNLENKNPDYASRIKYISYIIYIVSFMIYKNSLFTCENISENECIEKYNLKIIFQCFIQCIISGFILSANLALIFWKFIPAMHIFIFIGFIFLLLLFDAGNNIYSHGLINFIILFITIVFGFLLFGVLEGLIESIISRKFFMAYFLCGIMIFTISSFFLMYFLIINCSHWEKGFSNNYIDNKESCQIIKPSKCYINALNGLFDFSKMTKYSCEKNENHFFAEVLDNYIIHYDKEFSENATVLNYPKTNLLKLNGDLSFDKAVAKNMKGTQEKDFQNSEVFLVKNGKYANIEMHIKKNITLEEERKKLSKNGVKIKNIIFIYFDILSRAHFHRKLPDFSKFLSDLSRLSNNKYESFEFFKYHTFGNDVTHTSTLSMLFGKDSLTNDKPLNIISHLKKNGYITAQSANICSQNLNVNLNTNNILNEKFDHENVAMFCDPLYNFVTEKNSNIKGINSCKKRCLYGKNTYEHVINYGNLFWNAYPNNNKFLLMGFFDGNDKSGEVIKYMDFPLGDFLLDLINQGKFIRTALVIASPNGQLNFGIFNKMDSEFFYEKNLGSFFIVLDKIGIEKELIQKIKKNQQSFVTPYDIYDTIISMGYDCYDDECWEKIGKKSKKGKSVFYVINSKERNCENYNEILANECYCFK